MKQARVKTFCVVAAALMALPACRKSGGGGRASNPEPTSAPVVSEQLPPNVQPNTAVVDAPPGRPALRYAKASARNDELWAMGRAGRSDMRSVCARGHGGQVMKVESMAHYYIQPGASTRGYQCQSGYGYFSQPVLRGSTCLHPCRTLSADPRFYRPGEVLYFPALVGLRCGTGVNAMVHDGFMVVSDEFPPDASGGQGRFGFFWGRCNSDQNGFCQDPGAVAIDFALTFSNYCRAWRPQDPLHHAELKLAMYNRVRKEAVRRGDRLGSSFDLDQYIGLGVNANGVIFRRSDQPPY